MEINMSINNKEVFKLNSEARCICSFHADAGLLDPAGKI